MSQNSLKYFSLGSIFFLVSLVLSLAGYFSHFSLLHYFAFLSFLISMGLMLSYLKSDLMKIYSSNTLAYLLLFGLIGFYITQRIHVPDFFFSVLDASSYYQSGISAVLQKNDIGFFLPLTSALFATAFQLFGYEYAPYMAIMAYFPAVIFVYYLFTKFGLSSLLSYLMVLLFMSIPLNIWLSKTSFSEPLWQVLLLLFLVVSQKIIDKKMIGMVEYLTLVFILILVAFSRGEGVLLYGMIFLLALYHFWKYLNLTSSLLVLSSLIFLILSMYITLQIRNPYLLTYQFSRIIHGVSMGEFMTLLGAVFLTMLIMLLVIYKIKNKFKVLWFPFIIVILTLVFKWVTAMMLSVKKHTLFTQLLFQNEYTFILGNFGFILTISAMLGMLIMYIRAMRGESISLIIIVFYTLFYIPFMMQNSIFGKEHEFYLYWSRYYFSIIMVIHIFAIGVLFQTFSSYLLRIFKKEKYVNIVMIVSVFFVSFVSMDMNLYKQTTKEAYLENSYHIFPWLRKNVEDKSITVVYASDIKYRNYDVKQLMRKGFKILGLNIKYYRQVRAKEFNTLLKLPEKTFKSEYLLCLSQTGCMIDNLNLQLVDKLYLPISWRSKGGVSGKNKIDLNAFLFKRE